MRVYQRLVVAAGALGCHHSSDNLLTQVIRDFVAKQARCASAGKPGPAAMRAGVEGQAAPVLATPAMREERLGGSGAQGSDVGGQGWPAVRALPEEPPGAAPLPGSGLEIGFIDNVELPAEVLLEEEKVSAAMANLGAAEDRALAADPARLHDPQRQAASPSAEDCEIDGEDHQCQAASSVPPGIPEVPAYLERFFEHACALGFNLGDLAHGSLFDIPPEEVWVPSQALLSFEPTALDSWRAVYLRLGPEAAAKFASVFEEAWRGAG